MVEVFLKCDKCVFTTPWNFSLSSHVKSSHRRFREEAFNCNLPFIEQYLCPDWDYRTDLKVNLDIHIRSGHDWTISDFLQEINPEQWQCQHCAFKTFSRLLSQVHNCQKDFMSKSNIKIFEAIKDSRKENVRMNLRKKVERKSFRCCPKSHLKRQHKSVHKIEWFKCEHCSYKTKRKSLLDRHNSNIHEFPSCKEINEIEWFYCKDCSYKSKSKSNLNSHVSSMHSSGKVLKWCCCNECSYKAKYPSDLKRHIIIYHTPDDEVKWFRCDHCDFKSKYPRHLKSHVKTLHASRDPSDLLHCVVCDYTTYSKGNLRSHTSTVHIPISRVEWFECETCPFKTKRKNCLKQHVLTRLCKRRSKNVNKL